MVALRALVFRPLVKGNEDSGNEIAEPLIRQGYKKASSMPADSSENFQKLQLCQRNVDEI